MLIGIPFCMIKDPKLTLPNCLQCAFEQVLDMVQTTGPASDLLWTYIDDTPTVRIYPYSISPYVDFDNNVVQWISKLTDKISSGEKLKKNRK